EGPRLCHAEERRPRSAGQGHPSRARRSGICRRQRCPRRQADRTRSCGECGRCRHRGHVQEAPRQHRDREFPDRTRAM
ncbi:MAG: Phosphoribosylformylglycinamidine synthase, PurS subunit, partial [uncultured Sphingosinicella sp.]